ncbi:Sensory transduction protein regX3 [compost metagenome]
MGGDDYITKPFKLGELCSRIRALLRRAGAPKPYSSGSTLESGGLRIDLLGSRVTLHGNLLELTSMEYRLLCLLVRNTGRVVSRTLILENVWDSTGEFVDDNTLSVYIRRLREKLENDPSQPQRLATVRGFGYQWNEVRS